MEATTIAAQQSRLREARSGTWRNNQMQRRITIVLFLLPAIVLFALFVIYPLIQAVYYSFYNWKGFGPAVDFTWFDNYRRILSDKNFVIAVRNNLTIAILSIAIQMPLSMGLAIMVGRKLRGRTFFRTLFFMPYVFSEVMTGLIWASMYNPDPQFGLLNAILEWFPGAPRYNFLGDPQMVVACIFAALTWKYFGFHMLLYMAGLQSIPAEVEEAAAIDGANIFQTVRYVIVPMLGSTIRTAVYISFLGSLHVFGLIWIMSQGGPVGASETMATYMYRFGFVRFYLGYGSAVAVVLALLCMVFSLIYQRFATREEVMGSTA